MDSDDYTESSSSESETYECKKVTIMRKKRKTDHAPAKSKKSHGRKRHRSDSSEETSRSSAKPARCNMVKDKSKKKQKTSTRKIENHRCCPHMIPPIIKRLTPKQKDWVKNIGWGVFLEMPECQLPKPLTIWLVGKVNTKDKTLEIDSQNTIPIDKGIEQLLGLPNGNIRIPHPKSLRTLPKAKKAYPDPSNAKFSEHGRGKKLANIIEDLVANNDEDDFCISFVMVILAIYLAPGTGQTLNRGFLPHIRDVKKIKEMNWCDFAVQYLMKGIIKFRSNLHTNINLQGCVHILLLVYINAIRSSKISVPPGSPRMIFVTTALLDLLAEEDQKDIKGSIHEYGFLMSNEQDKNMVATGPTMVGALDLTWPSMIQKYHATTSKSEASKKLQCNKALESLFLELKSSIHRNRAEIIAKMAESESQIFDLFMEKAKEIVMENNIMYQDKSAAPHSEVDEVDKISSSQGQALVSKADHVHSEVDLPDQGNLLQDVAIIGNLGAREATESLEIATEEETHHPEFKCTKDQTHSSGAVSGSFSPEKITDPNGNQQEKHQVVEGVDCSSPACRDIAQQSTQSGAVPPSDLGSVAVTHEIHTYVNQSEAAPTGSAHEAEKTQGIELDSQNVNGCSTENKLQVLKQNGSELPGDVQLGAGNSVVLPKLDLTDHGNQPEVPGTDESAKKAITSAPGTVKVKTEPGGDTSALSGKKRNREEANSDDGPCHSELSSLPTEQRLQEKSDRNRSTLSVKKGKQEEEEEANSELLDCTDVSQTASMSGTLPADHSCSANCFCTLPGFDPKSRHLPVPDTHDVVDITGPEAARKELEHTLAAKLSESILQWNDDIQTVNCSLELKKELAAERDAELEKTKAEHAAERAELQDAEAVALRGQLKQKGKAGPQNVEFAAALRQVMECEDHVRRRAEHALDEYRRRGNKENLDYVL